MAGRAGADDGSSAGVGHLASALRAWLVEQDRTGGWLASRAGVSRATVSRLLNRTGYARLPEPGTLEAISAITGIGVEEMRRLASLDMPGGGSELDEGLDLLRAALGRKADRDAALRAARAVIDAFPDVG